MNARPQLPNHVVVWKPSCDLFHQGIGVDAEAVLTENKEKITDKK